jgi:hypothetical protein
MRVPHSSRAFCERVGILTLPEKLNVMPSGGCPILAAPFAASVGILQIVRS